MDRLQSCRAHQDATDDTAFDIGRVCRHFVYVARIDDVGVNNQPVADRGQKLCCGRSVAGMAANFRSHTGWHKEDGVEPAGVFCLPPPKVED